jgi:flagellar protein FlaG
MSNKVAAVAATADPAYGPSQPQPRPRLDGRAKAPPLPDSVDLRLVIEEDQASGSFVYKTVNRVTGEVILQLPRAELLRIHEGRQYAAGAVIRTKA